MRKWMIAAVVLVVAAGPLEAQEAPAAEKAEAPGKAARKMVHQIVVQVHFITGTAGKMRDLGLSFDGPSKTSSAEHLAALLRRMRDLPEFTQLAAPKITMMSGQRAYIAVTNTTTSRTASRTKIERNSNPSSACSWRGSISI